MSKISLRSGLVLAAALGFLGAGSAFSGEVNGNGDVIPGGAKGKSECSFSGQQDDPVADEGVFRGDRVQSWGQLPVMDRLYIMLVIGWTPGSKDPFPLFEALGSCNGSSG